MNVVVLDGRLTKDPEIKMKDTKEILVFTIASQRDKEHSDFIECVAFDNNAKFINNYFKKGSGINIIGTLRHSLYQNKDGKTESTTRVVVNTITFPIKPPKEETQIDDTKVQDTKDIWESAKDIELSDEELPFY